MKLSHGIQNINFWVGAWRSALQKNHSTGSLGPMGEQGGFELAKAKLHGANGPPLKKPPSSPASPASPDKTGVIVTPDAKSRSLILLSILSKSAPMHIDTAVTPP